MILQRKSDLPKKNGNVYAIDNPLSICFVVTTPFAVNGFLINHLNQLAKLHAVTLCVNLNLYPLSSELNRSKVKVINVDFERQLNVKKDIYAIFMLINFFRISKFDVIHSITPKAGLLSMLAGFFYRVPSRFHTFTGQFWVNYVGLKKIFYQKIDWLIAHLATQVFADSSSQREFLISQGICKQFKISLLGAGSISGVDLTKFYFDSEVRQVIRQQHGIESEDCVFLFVGRLTKDKGVLDLIKAYELLKNRTDARFSMALWIVGPDEEEIEVFSKQLLKGVDLNIYWFGPTFRPQDFMTAADVLVLPSYREGFGSVLIEAAACFLPTIAYRIDGIVDAVEDGGSGLLCEVGNISKLTECMDLLLMSKEYRAKLGRYGQRQVRERFSSTQITQAWVNFYLQISNSRNYNEPPSKRIFDLLLALVVVPFLFLPMVVIHLFVLIKSGPPALYWSERVGKNNRLFLMPKYRTMISGAPVVATHLLVDPEAHITKIGRFLRKSSLDELPQIWSIIKGDMSFVGPRPALFNQQDVIDQRKALGIDQLRPGLTGWAQINGRDEIPLEQKIQLDAQYLQRQSPWFDLYILWLTFVKVVRGEGVSH